MEAWDMERVEGGYQTWDDEGAKIAKVNRIDHEEIHTHAWKTQQRGSIGNQYQNGGISKSLSSAGTFSPGSQMSYANKKGLQMG